MTDVAAREFSHVNEQALAALACPVCGDSLEFAGNALACSSGHAFDIARQGYVSLLTRAPSPGTGDSAEMVAARERFLQGDHYLPIAEAVIDSLATHAPSTCRPIADVGAGTGWLLGRVLDADASQRAGIAIDLSKYAARRAARAHPRVLSVVADAWTALPLATGAVDVVLNFFAPRNAAEFARILAPGGIATVLTPLPGHLAELHAALPLLSIEPTKDERLAATMAADFEPAHTCDIEFTMRLSRANVADIVAMGPSSHHLDPNEIGAAITSLPVLVEATGAVKVSTFRLRNRL